MDGPIFVILVVAMGGLLGLLVAAVLRRSSPRVAAKRVGGTTSVRPREIPQVFEQLQRGRFDGSWAAFCFRAKARAEREQIVNVQFSVEGGKVGFDWVLEAPANVAHREEFEALARAKGYAPEEKLMNGVYYLRVEEGDLPRLCSIVVRDMYRLPDIEEMELVSDGFEYQMARGA